MGLVIGYLVLLVFFVILSYICIYCLLQFQLCWIYKNKYRDPSSADSKEIKTDLPHITIQLPLYNEMLVVERLIDKVCEMDYPRELMEIQILDDSSDETTQLAEKKAALKSREGFDIRVITRPDRRGFKAGALDFGLKRAKGEFIAIFDADFLPDKRFLKNTLPFFNRPEIGVVQTRWTHINKNYSLITRLQAFQLNVHFSIEQSGRSYGGYFLQFNGTAGVWRKTTIEDAGGWSADTLTEDLDLSYRAQLRGWKIAYREEVESPAELPADMNAFKTQQYRWMKGGAETAKKLLPAIWKSSLSMGKKVHATVHLLGSSIFLLVLLAGILSVPALYYLPAYNINPHYFSVFLAGLLSLVVVYYIGNRANPFYRGKKGIRDLLTFSGLFVVFLSLSMGMSLHNSLAVVHGYMGKKSPFVRTPKFNILKAGDSFKRSIYLSEKIPLTTYFEAILALFFAAAVIYGILFDQYSFVIYHLLLAIGFATISFYSFRHYAWQR